MIHFSEYLSFHISYTQWIGNFPFHAVENLRARPTHTCHPDNVPQRREITHHNQIDYSFESFLSARFLSNFSPKGFREEDKDIMARVNSLPHDIRSKIAKSVPLLMAYVTSEFMKYPPDSQILKSLWTEIVLLSFFRKIDQDYLCYLHNNADFLNAITRFHMYNSKCYRSGSGFNWIGGLDYRPKSLSKELASIYTHIFRLGGFYEHYVELLNGKFHHSSQDANSSTLFCQI